MWRVGCLVALFISSAGSLSVGKKNVLFFAVDDLRTQLNCYGPIPGTNNPTMHTPNIDALAARSLLLKKNYVQQAVCSPTRTSLLTGRRPDTTHVYDLYSYFRNVGGNFTTIPEFFKQQGYYTIGMGKIFHPGHASGQDDSCCSWSAPYWHAPNLPYWTGTSPNGNRFRAGDSWAAVPEDIEKEHPLPDNQIADHAVETLHSFTKDKMKEPFFLAVGFHKPHLPFIFSQRFEDLYPVDEVQLPPDQQPPHDMPPIAWSAYGELRHYADQAKLNATGKPGTVLPPNDVKALRRAYYSAVSYTDDLIGKVIQALEDTGHANDTIISFWGDHGWQLGEHGEWCKHTNFEFATHAPMMIHVPGVTDHGIPTTQYTEHADLFPTLAELIGHPLDPCPIPSTNVTLCAEGVSLTPLMQNPTNPVKKASFSQYPRGYVKPGMERAGEDLFYAKPSVSPCIEDNKKCTMGYSLITEVKGVEHRYTEWVDFNTIHRRAPNWDRLVGRELYNHQEDPGENFNLVHNASLKSLIQQLSTELRAGPPHA